MIGHVTSKRTRVFALYSLTLLLLLAACTQDPALLQPAAPAGSSGGAGSYTNITVGHLVEMLEDKQFTLVNVHIPYEGEIPDTDLFIPFDEIEDHVGDLPNKDVAIVLYCRSGPMSTTAADTLVSLGYTNVMEVDGGMNAWQAAGYDLHGRE
jgi:rhodanese-related sulfurtransferase